MYGQVADCDIIGDPELLGAKRDRAYAFALEPDASIAQLAADPRFGLVWVQAEIECSAVFVVLDQEAMPREQPLQRVSVGKFKCVLVTNSGHLGRIASVQRSGGRNGRKRVTRPA